MSNPDYANDKARIVELFEGMFAAVSWTEGPPPRS